MLVNVHEAKTQLSKLLERVAAGEEVIIGKAGKPVARLVKFEPSTKVSPSFGVLKGQIWLAEDFDELDAETQAAFDGELP